MRTGRKREPNMTTVSPSKGGHSEAPRAPNSGLSFPVVGLGASAGGLAALSRLFEAMPPTTGMAFVVILHLSPKHASSAAEILQKSTRMRVSQIQSATR